MVASSSPTSIDMVQPANFNPLKQNHHIQSLMKCFLSSKLENKVNILTVQQENSPKSSFFFHSITLFSLTHLLFLSDWLLTCVSKCSQTSFTQSCDTMPFDASELVYHICIQTSHQYCRDTKCYYRNSRVAHSSSKTSYYICIFVLLQYLFSPDNNHVSFILKKISYGLQL